MKTDPELQQDVIKEISEAPSIESTSFVVHVKEGVVTLAGRLRSFSEKCAIGQLVQKMPGVAGLTMALTVELPEYSRRPDTEIAEAAQYVLRWTNFLPKDQIKSAVHNGHITLSGNVDWEYQRMAAKRAVRDLFGVTGISNDIKVLHTAISLDIKAMVEAEALTKNRRAFTDSESVDYPDVIGVDC